MSTTRFIGTALASVLLVGGLIVIVSQGPSSPQVSLPAPSIKVRDAGTGATSLASCADMLPQQCAAWISDCGQNFAVTYNGVKYSIAQFCPLTCGVCNAVPTSAPTPAPAGSGLYTLSSAQIKQELDQHNSLRAELKAGTVPGQPQAKSMPTMEWDTALEATAKNYASQCIWAHNADRASDFVANGGTSHFVGENIAYSSVVDQTALSSVMTELTNAWWDEYKNYNYASNSCASGAECGHYTQMAWADSIKLGCGVGFCSNMVNIGQPGTFLVCDYAPAGNFNGEKPYVAV